jgi:hypothetical protein
MKGSAPDVNLHLQVALGRVLKNREPARACPVKKQTNDEKPCAAAPLLEGLDNVLPVCRRLRDVF